MKTLLLLLPLVLTSVSVEAASLKSFQGRRVTFKMSHDEIAILEQGEVYNVVDRKKKKITAKVEITKVVPGKGMIGTIFQQDGRLIVGVSYDIAPVAMSLYPIEDLRADLPPEPVTTQASVHLASNQTSSANTKNYNKLPITAEEAEAQFPSRRPRKKQWQIDLGLGMETVNDRSTNQSAKNAEARFLYTLDSLPYLALGAQTGVSMINSKEYPLNALYKGGAVLLLGKKMDMFKPYFTYEPSFAVADVTIHEEFPKYSYSIDSTAASGFSHSANVGLNLFFNSFLLGLEYKAFEQYSLQDNLKASARGLSLVMGYTW